MRCRSSSCVCALTDSRWRIIFRFAPSSSVHCTFCDKVRKKKRKERKRKKNTEKLKWYSIWCDFLLVTTFLTFICRLWFFAFLFSLSQPLCQSLSLYSSSEFRYVSLHTKRVRNDTKSVRMSLVKMRNNLENEHYMPAGNWMIWVQVHTCDGCWIAHRYTHIQKKHEILHSNAPYHVCTVQCGVVRCDAWDAILELNLQRTNVIDAHHSTYSTQNTSAISITWMRATSKWLWRMSSQVIQSWIECLIFMIDKILDRPIWDGNLHWLNWLPATRGLLAMSLHFSWLTAHSSQLTRHCHPSLAIGELSTTSSFDRAKCQSHHMHWSARSSMLNGKWH